MSNGHAGQLVLGCPMIDPMRQVLKGPRGGRRFVNPSTLCQNRLATAGLSRLRDCGTNGNGHNGGTGNEDFMKHRDLHDVSQVGSQVTHER